MDALLSAPAGVALLIDGHELSSIHVGFPGRRVPRRPEEVHLLFGERSELQLIQNVDLDEISRRLEQEVDAAEALQLALILLDPEASDDIRQEAAVELEDYLGRGDCRERLERVLYAHLLPGDGDLDGALAHSDGHAPKAHLLIRDFASLQPEIDEVRRAWLAVPDSLFESETDRRRFQAAAVREGLFRGFVLARREGKPVDPLLVSALLKLAIRDVQGYRNILLAWAAPFKQRHERRWGAFSEVAETIAEPQRRERRRVGDRKKILEKVERQKRAIVDAMKARDLPRAREFVGDLVEFNLDLGGPEYAVKSLCDLAKKAKDLGFGELQLELTGRAVEVKPDDGRAWAQHGDALLSNHRSDAALEAFANASSFGSAAGGCGQGEVLRSLGRFEAALAAYDDVIELFPDDVVARKGRAETLRDMGWLTEALAAYDDVVQRFPDDVVARNGRAETLRDMGRLTEALAAYDDVIQRFPDNVFARTGRAETLRDLGRLTEALAAYDHVIQRFPDNVVARSGRAETLRSLGRLEDALAAYDRSLEQFPGDPVARNGRADLLAAMGRWEEALETLPTGEPSHLQDWIAYHIRGMILLRQGKLGEAESSLRKGVESCPFPAQRDYFRSALAVLRLRQREYPAAVAVLQSEETPVIAPEMDLLRLHALAAGGEREKAAAVERRLRSSQQSADLAEVRDELSRRYLQHLPPRKTDEWIHDREIALLLAAVGTYLLRRRRAF